MSSEITRRDFLNGAALAVGAGLVPLDQAGADPVRYYPPALTGMRGSHPGAFETAHQLGREGRRFDLAGLPVEESYDLVVVGGGISGLASALFYRDQHPDARILVLENHDDFGGHAKRNEFTVDGRLLIGYGGSETLQSPKAMFSPVAKRLMARLGVRFERWHTAFDLKLYPSLGLKPAVFFDRETFGQDRLVVGDPTIEQADSVTVRHISGAEAAAAIEQFPISAEARARFVRFLNEPRDYLHGKSKAEKLAHLRHISYRDYLKQDAGLGEEEALLLDGRTKDYLAMGADITPASAAAAGGFVGFGGLGLRDVEEEGLDEPYIYHFPDGNASIARLLVRQLIPDVARGSGMEDVVLAAFDYDRLDRDGTPLRIRLNSTAVAVANPARRGDPVEIGYIRAGGLHRIHARHVVLACWNMIIPYLMPELPPEQRAALALDVKLPLVYANVAIRNWRAFHKLGIERIYSPWGFFSNVKLDYPVSLGGYRNPTSPDEPIVLHMVHIPNTPNQGYDNVTQFRMGRQKLLETPFGRFEAEIKGQLDRMLGAGGFDSSRDIAAITVNRWPHGYAYDANSLFDATRDGPPPYEIARRRAGQVTIANADAAWNAYAHEAIDQAWRAVAELAQA